MNLSQKILDALKNTKNLDDTQKDIEKYQSNLLKNINSSLLDNEEKNKLLKVYMDLHDVGKSLYRYGILKKNNHLAAAEEEKEEVKHKVLKGYICNIKYVWRSEHGEHTCDECASMDGEEFEFYEDIPPQPHPNCKCYVEVLECPYEPEDSSDDNDENDENYGSEDRDERSSDGVPQSRQDKSDKNKDTQPQKQNEELCDCWKLVEKYDELISKAENLISEVKIKIEHLDILGLELQQIPDKYTEWVLDELRKTDSFLGDLTRNMYEGRQDITLGADKYYHSKANCQVAQRRSEIEANLALSTSFLRECEQWLWSIATRQKTREEANRDFKEDMDANWRGYYEGLYNKDKSCEDILKDMPHKE